MDELVHADTFFVITSVAIIIVTIIIVVVSVYVIKILRRVDHITETVREESVYLASDLRELRSNVRAGKITRGVKSFISSFWRRSKRRKSSKK